MKQKILFLLLSTLFVFHNIYSQQINDEKQIITFSKTVEKLNPSDKTYPGGRGANELVVYTPLFGDTTGTNKYGIEAIVIENKIQSISGNNSKIPNNGFVISGHGSELQWISKELFPGIEVELVGKEINFKVTEDTKIFYADYLVNEVETKLNTWECNYESVSLKKLVELKKEINLIKNKYYAAIDKNLSIVENHPQLILDKALTMYYQSFPSYTKEVRASWYHLREKSPAELEETIKLMVDIGFNTICPEVIYGGYSIYPNAHLDLIQNPAFIGWDPMRELERLCKKYEIKLVPWVWVFFVGRETSPLVESKPEWLAVSKQKEIPARLENNHHFFCPSKKEVRKFLIEVYQQFISNYEFDGLQLDYIRYPVSLPDEHGFCYCDTCRDNFKALTNSDPLQITAEDNPELWSQWTDYRKEQITSFVGEVADLIKNSKSDIKLSADVFPLFEESINYKFQDWGTWLNKGYLDEIFTMSYTPEAGQVKKESEFLVEHLPQGIKGYVGLGPFMGFRPEILVQEIFYAQDAGADGICLFSFGSLTPEQIEALKQGPFRKKTTIH